MLALLAVLALIVLAVMLVGGVGHKIPDHGSGAASAMLADRSGGGEER